MYCLTCEFQLKMHVRPEFKPFSGFQSDFMANITILQMENDIIVFSTLEFHITCVRFSMFMSGQPK